MFGVLIPALDSVSIESNQLYNRSYCNLCAALSGSGVSVFNRLFLINDIVTLDWLLTEKQPEQYPFSCNNCLKGGVIGKKQRISSRQKVLAALSTFICGVKINDDAIDAPTMKNQLLAMLYRPFMKKADTLLNQHNMLDTLKKHLEINRRHEEENAGTLQEACEGTEKAYQFIFQSIAHLYDTSFPESTVALLGQYLGRCTYLLDAIRDMDNDKEQNQYNVLNCLTHHQTTLSAKQQAISLSLEFLKPMRIDIARQWSSLPENLQLNTLREKCDGLFISIERQLAGLIKPLHDDRLKHILSSFSVASALGTCANRPYLADSDSDHDQDTTVGVSRGKTDVCCKGGRPCDLPGAE